MNSSFITRKKKGKNQYLYYYKKKPMKNPKIVKDIEKIYIPPAYKNVKFYLNKPYKATGIDSAGRTQYLYDEASIKKREIKKANMLKKMSKNINNLQKSLKRDIQGEDFTKTKMVALVLKIMDLCNFRIGNEKYEMKYGSYGITTLHKKHVKIKKNEIDIDFIGKKGVQNKCIIKNPEIQKIVKKLYALSTRKDDYLFLIKDKGIKITMTDVNSYLKQFHITAKDLRTWNANILFLKALHRIVQKNELDIKKRKKQIKEAILETSILLHHTPFICRKSYIFKNMLNELEINGFERILKNNNYESILESFF